MSKKVLLVGCGGVGSRHLQALSCVKEIVQIHVVDANPAMHEIGRGRIKEAEGHREAIKYQWHQSFNPAIAKGDLCVLATQAKGRVGLIECLARDYGYRLFLVEKLVTQSMTDYLRLEQLCDQLDLKIFVHCQTRLYPVHQYIKSKLDPAKPIFFSEVGGNHGLACNGIHYADLFLFYDGSNQIIPGTVLNTALHQTKRGNGVYDLSGVMTGSTAKGSQCVIAYAADHQQSDVVMIVNADSRYMVDIIQGTAFESQGHGPWQPLSIEGSIFVSQTSKGIVEDLLRTGASALPSLRECAGAHAFILNQLQAAFNHHLGQSLDYCPTT